MIVFFLALISISLFLWFVTKQSNGGDTLQAPVELIWIGIVGCENGYNCNGMSIITSNNYTYPEGTRVVCVIHNITNPQLSSFAPFHVIGYIHNSNSDNIVMIDPLALENKPFLEQSLVMSNILAGNKAPVYGYIQEFGTQHWTPPE